MAKTKTDEARLTVITSEEVHNFLKSHVGEQLKNTIIYKDFPIAETKMAEGAPRTLVVKISSINPDRSNDTVQPKGMVADNFMKNPVVLYAHDYKSLPIAKCTSLKITDDSILATVEFPEEGINPKADTIYKLYKGGFLNAWSIGFMPLKDGYEENNNGGYNFTAWEIFEFSGVPVPDNPEALTIMRSKGIDVDALIAKQADTNSPAPAPVAKDVGEVIALAYILDELHHFIRSFQQAGVNQDCIDKLSQALVLVMEVTKLEAVIGEKSIVLGEMIMQTSKTIVKVEPEPVAKSEPEPKAEPEPEAVINRSYMKRLAETLKHASRSTNLTLRLLNEIERTGKAVN